MSVLLHLKTLLAGKVIAVAGVATLVGGAAAIANPASPILELVPASEHQDDDELDEAEDVEETEEVDDVDETEEVDDVDAVEEIAEVEKVAEIEQVTGGDELLADDEPREGEELLDDDELDGERSDVATDVHAQLTGDPDVVPGSRAFGQAVSAYTREHGNGRAAAVREANGSAERGADEEDDEDLDEVSEPDSELDVTNEAEHDGPPRGRGPRGDGPPGHGAAKRP